MMKESIYIGILDTFNWNNLEINIADIFHISERAVKKRIATAKKQIKTMFRKEDFL